MVVKGGGDGLGLPTQIKGFCQRGCDPTAPLDALAEGASAGVLLAWLPVLPAIGVLESPPGVVVDPVPVPLPDVLVDPVPVPAWLVGSGRSLRVERVGAEPAALPTDAVPVSVPASVSSAMATGARVAATAATARTVVANFVLLVASVVNMCWVPTIPEEGLGAALMITG